MGTALVHVVALDCFPVRPCRSVLRLPRLACVHTPLGRCVVNAGLGTLPRSRLVNVCLAPCAGVGQVRIAAVAVQLQGYRRRVGRCHHVARQPGARRRAREDGAHSEGALQNSNSTSRRSALGSLERTVLWSAWSAGCAFCSPDPPYPPMCLPPPSTRLPVPM